MGSLMPPIGMNNHPNLSRKSSDTFANLNDKNQTKTQANPLTAKKQSDSDKSLSSKSQANPFTRSFQAGANARLDARRVLDGAEFNQFSKLHKKGIDGKGVNVENFEAAPKEMADETKSHLGATKRLMEHPSIGLAPGASVKNNLVEIKNLPSLEFKDDPKSFKESLDRMATTSLDQSASRFSELAKNNPEKIKVLNLSGGMSQAEMMITSFGMLGPKGDNPNIKKEIFGDSNMDIQKATPEQQKQFIQKYSDYVGQHLEKSDAFQKSLKNYQDSSKLLTGSGVFPVVSNGNYDSTFKDFGTKLPEGAYQNFAAKSPNVLSAGSVNNNFTPGNYNDDKVSTFSAPGSKQFKPTAVLQGENVPVATENGQSFTIRDGTSYSSPAMSSVVAMMLQKNPNLTFDQVGEGLSKSSIPLKGVSDLEQGAGVLDPEKAVEYAGAIGK